MANRSGAPLRSVQRISAVNVMPRDAETLGLLNGSAVLKVEHTSYLISGRVAQISRALYRPDAYEVVTDFTTSPILSS